MTTPQRIEILDRKRCLDLLASCSVGRIVYTIKALPAIHPINYVFDGHDIVVRTASDSTLAEADRSHVVAFEIDHVDPQSRSGWNVVVLGQARAATAPADIARLDRLGLHSWVLKDGEGTYVRIPATMVTGRLVHPPDGVPAAPAPEQADGPAIQPLQD